MPSTVTLRLPPTPRAAGEARRAVVGLCRQSVDCEYAETAALLTSELVTNAVRHACGIVTVVAVYEQGKLGVAVRDDSPQGCSIQVVDELDERGRGLVILEALSSAWGVRPDPGGKSVWFRLG
jgi:anti-sigma regulatory factor (Ser/Thr protein kinase)